MSHTVDHDLNLYLTKRKVNGATVYSWTVEGKGRPDASSKFEYTIRKSIPFDSSQTIQQVIDAAAAKLAEEPV